MHDYLLAEEVALGIDDVHDRDEPHVLHHYIESKRLLRVAEDAAIDPGIRDLAARMATARAVLTLSPRRARRVERPARHVSNGLPSHLNWPDE